MRRTTAGAVLMVVLGGCTGAPAASAVRGSQDLICANAIDGDPPPRDFRVVLGVVALPAGPGYPALQAAASGGGPGIPSLFAKTGLVVRAGATVELVVDGPSRGGVGIGWGGAPSAPSQRFVVPSCPDARGTGWLAYPGGYWADRPLCLPMLVRTGGREQRVEIGVGRPCPGQRPPPP